MLRKYDYPTAVRRSACTTAKVNLVVLLEECFAWFWPWCSGVCSLSPASASKTWTPNEESSCNSVHVLALHITHNTTYEYRVGCINSPTTQENSCEKCSELNFITFKHTHIPNAAACHKILAFDMALEVFISIHTYIIILRWTVDGCLLNKRNFHSFVL